MTRGRLAADFSGAEERRVERPPTLSMSSTDYSLSGQAGAAPCILALPEPCEADVSMWAWSSFLRKNCICWAWGTLAAWVRAHLAWALTPHSPSGPWRSFAPRHPLCAPGFLVQRLQAGLVELYLEMGSRHYVAVKQPPGEAPRG